MKYLIIGFLFLSLSGQAQNVKTLPVEEFEKNISGNEIQLLDVRKTGEYNSGHLPGAFQADWLDKKQFEYRVKYLDKNRPVYLYCLSGIRSAAAANWLGEQGFTTVVNMKGGIMEWKKEGRPVATEIAAPQMTEEKYTSLLHSNELVLVDFGALWCIPCKKMEPVLNKLLQEHAEIKLVKIDAGIETELVKKYQVEGLPVFILYKGGKEVWRQEGVVEKKDFVKAIKKASK